MILNAMLKNTQHLNLKYHPPLFSSVSFFFTEDEIFYLFYFFKHLILNDFLVFNERLKFHSILKTPWAVCSGSAKNNFQSLINFSFAGNSHSDASSEYSKTQFNVDSGEADIFKALNSKCSFKSYYTNNWNILFTESNCLYENKCNSSSVTRWKNKKNESKCRDFNGCQRQYTSAAANASVGVTGCKRKDEDRSSSSNQQSSKVSNRTESPINQTLYNLHNFISLNNNNSSYQSNTGNFSKTNGTIEV